MCQQGPIRFWTAGARRALWSNVDKSGYGFKMVGASVKTSCQKNRTKFPLIPGVPTRYAICGFRSVWGCQCLQLWIGSEPSNLGPPETHLDGRNPKQPTWTLWKYWDIYYINWWTPEFLNYPRLVPKSPLHWGSQVKCHWWSGSAATGLCPNHGKNDTGWQKNPKKHINPPTNCQTKMFIRGGVFFWSLSILVLSFSCWTPTKKRVGMNVQHGVYHWISTARFPDNLATPGKAGLQSRLKHWKHPKWLHLRASREGRSWSKYVKIHG